jgi:hypothetical protein
MVVTDAFWAAGTGEEPKMYVVLNGEDAANIPMDSPDEHVEVAGAWVTAVEEKLPLSTFKALAVSGVPLISATSWLIHLLPSIS